ncbi:DEAD/DEAH box helicase [Olivibacter jilunii]|uniref:DEAD/DEAH box helicase n=1 Tax=Olivibacter jilunii TaxID=985016 RepID=UPI003F5CC246
MIKSNMKTAEQPENTHEVAVNEQEQPRSVKRKSSDPYLIPWEDGEPFKLSSSYLEKIVSNYKALSSNKNIYSYLEKFFIDEIEFDVREGGKRYSVYIKINEKNLFIRCSCKAKVKTLCKHEFVVLVDCIENNNTYFRSFHFPELLKVDKKYHALFNFNLEDHYYYYGRRPYFSAHEEHGRVFQFSNDGEHFDEVLTFDPFPALAHRQAKLVFGIPIHPYHYEIPILLPYLTKIGSKASLKNPYAAFEKSFLFEEKQLMVPFSPEEEQLIAICKKMLFLKQRSYEEISCFVVKKGTSSEQYESANRIRKKLYVDLWKTIIPKLSKYKVGIFKASQSGAMYVKPTSHVLFSPKISMENVNIGFELIEKDDYTQLKLLIMINGETIDFPRFMTKCSSFFLEKANDEFVFIDSVKDEELLQKFRECNFVLTVLPNDFEKFKMDLLYPISVHYPITYCNQCLGHTQFLAKGILKVLKRSLSIKIEDDMIYLEPEVVYGNSVRVNPLFKGNMVLRYEEGKEALYDRDMEAEIGYCRFLFSLHEKFEDQQEAQRFYLPFSYVKQGTWLAEMIKALQDNGIEIVGLENLQGLPFLPHTMTWEMEIKGDKNCFDIDLQIHFGKQTVDLELLKERIKREREMVELPDGSVGLFPAAIQRKLGPILNLGEVKKHKVLLSSKHFNTVQSFANKITDNELRKRIKEQRQKLQALDKIQPLPKPEKVQAILRPYQETGFSWMGFLREFGWGGVLADDMGLGKTLQVLTLLDYHYMQTPDSAASLIVVPNTLLFNWQQEVKKFTPHRSVLVHHGLNRAAEIGCKPGQLILTTYGTLTTDIEMLSNKRFSYLILDESQAIKNPQSKRFDCAQSIQSDYRLALTGTPIENGISDLFAQLDFVNPGFLGTYGQFKRSFPGIADGSASDETKESLQRIIAPFMLRRTKAQVAKDLPEKTEMILYCDMLPEQRNIYEKYRQYFRGELANKVEERRDKATMFVLEALMKLRQICNSPAILPKETYPNHSSKLEEIQEHILEKTQGHKLLIFSSFTSMLGLLKIELEKIGIAYAYLDGKTSGEQRQQEVTRFQEQDDCRVFLISLKAGGTGLNLTAADYVYILDPWWNPAAEAQAIDRCYRIGQEKHVMAYRMICKDTIEEKILNMQANKKALADSLIQTDNSILKSLDKEELLKLFE